MLRVVGGMCCMVEFPEGSWDAARPVGLEDASRAAALLAARLPPALGRLAEVAYDYAWAWQQGEAVFRAIDSRRWDHARHNPVRLLLETPPPALERAARDEAYLARIDSLRECLEADRRRPFREEGSFSPRRPIVFVCAEFGVHRSLPVYAGGLGGLAGDYLKEASDAGLPAVGLGLYYRQGYFHQRVDASGWQHEYWIEHDAELRGLALVTGPDGGPLRVRVEIRGRPVVFQIWRAAVGRVSLYLLDANRPENHRVDRWINARLYESSREVRLAQYVALGVGGMRALRALGIDPGVIHLNEGHAALAALELTRHAVEERGASPKAALEASRERLVFTTHTPVAAGNETYPVEDLWSALGPLPQRIGLPAEELAGVGRIVPDDASEPFGMTVAALRTSRAANGVSRKHGEVARDMWRGLWPGHALPDVPIGHVTNGVHVPTWVAAPMRGLLGRHFGPDWVWRASDPATWAGVDAIPDRELWETRCALRAHLVEWVRDRSVTDRLARAEPLDSVESAAHTFDPDVLTLGFARRVAAYKRLHLLVHDVGRVASLLHGDRPVQVVLAGKAHPNDDGAKRLIQALFSQRQVDGMRNRVVFLEDYDLATAAALVAGCDVWLNVPRPPFEASGTSGMKSVLNGGLQLSVLDGWWAEAWDGENGWGLSPEPAGNEDERDARDAHALLDTLERDVIPLFYDRDASGVPTGWTRRMKASLRTLPHRFSASRMLAEYVERVYGARPPDPG